MSWWSVSNGAITATIPTDRPCSTNQYLVWQGGELADFELKLSARISGQGAINNGFQFRSRVFPDGDIAGYQVDNRLQTDWLVRLYDEFGRHTLAPRGKRTVFSADGTTISSDFDAAAGPAWFQLEAWHDYHLICEGPKINLRVNGRPAASIEDHDPIRADARGILALQLHSGPPSLIQFRDIRLKVLKPAADLRQLRWTRSPSAPARQKVLASALGYWDFGVGGHGARRPITAVGDSEFDVRSEGPGASPFTTVAHLRGAWFDAGPDWAIAGTGLTVFLRARDPSGRWDSTLMSKGSTLGDASFALYGTDLPETPGHDLVFEVTTTSGPARVSFPFDRIDATSWHSFVGVYDGETLRLLCDDRFLASTACKGGLLLENRAPLLVGAETRDGKPRRPFTGQLEEAALWPFALDSNSLPPLLRLRRLQQ